MENDKPKAPWCSKCLDHITMSDRCVELVKRIYDNCHVIHTGHEVEGEPSPCFEWQGTTTGSGRGGGYGRVSVDGWMALCHRVIWSCFHGFITPKRQVDHLCRNRLCCNHLHLEAVTHNQNQKRKDTVYEQIAEGKR